jgi:hypothetical protein
MARICAPSQPSVTAAIESAALPAVWVPLALNWQVPAVNGVGDAVAVTSRGSGSVELRYHQAAVGAGVPVNVTASAALPPAVSVADAGCAVIAGAAGVMTASVVLAVAFGLTPLLTVTATAALLQPAETAVSDSVAPPLLVAALPLQLPRVKAPLPTAVPLSVHA